MGRQFPFPDRAASRAELEGDPVYFKIDAERVDTVFEDAWNLGAGEARKFLARHTADGKLDMVAVLREKGVRLLREDIDNIVGNRRYFCEYFSNKNILKVYVKSVALWCGANGFEFEEGLNVILSHEYFHYLEWHHIGQTSKRCLVPMLKLGSFSLGKTGVPALSEIAANAFAGACFAYTANN